MEGMGFEPISVSPADNMNIAVSDFDKPHFSYTGLANWPTLPRIESCRDGSRTHDTVEYVLLQEPFPRLLFSCSTYAAFGDIYSELPQQDSDIGCFPLSESILKYLEKFIISKKLRTLFSCKKAAIGKFKKSTDNCFMHAKWRVSFPTQSPLL